MKAGVKYADVCLGTNRWFAYREHDLSGTMKYSRTEVLKRIMTIWADNETIVTTDFWFDCWGVIV